MRWRPFIVAPLSVAVALLLSAGMQSASLYLTSPARPHVLSATPAPIPCPPRILHAHTQDTRSIP